LASGIWVGPSGADGSFGPDTAKAVAMLDTSHFGTTTPGPNGVATEAKLAAVRELSEVEPTIANQAVCSPVEELVEVTAREAVDIFQLSDVRCSSGWATAILVEYGFADGTQLFFDLSTGAPRLVGGASGPENGCALYGVPPDEWEFFGCYR
jgi:hypothetical protein